jgi:hypothetical protein
LKVQPPENAWPHQKVEIVVLLGERVLFAGTQKSLGDEGVSWAEIHGKGFVEAHSEGRCPR